MEIIKNTSQATSVNRDDKTKYCYWIVLSCGHVAHEALTQNEIVAAAVDLKYVRNFRDQPWYKTRCRCAR